MAALKGNYSVHSITLANTLADVAQGQAVNKHWANELRDRIRVYGDTVDQFLNTVVPCSTPYALEPLPSTVFSGYLPKPGTEKKSYTPLVRIIGLYSNVSVF